MRWELLFSHCTGEEVEAQLGEVFAQVCQLAHGRAKVYIRKGIPEVTYHL